MSQPGVSEKVLLGVREHASKDSNLQAFLEELLLEEAEGLVRWKEYYRESMSRHTEGWALGNDED